MNTSVQSAEHAIEDLTCVCNILPSHAEHDIEDLASLVSVICTPSVPVAEPGQLPRVAWR